MDALLNSSGRILDGFQTTLALLVLSGALAMLLGLVLAAMRVSPVPVMRNVGTTYVNILRNTPLVLLFTLVSFGLPTIGVRLSFFTFAVIALGCYTAAFVCEALRSGVNAVSPGQAEAARALGLGFGQTLRLIVLPQAFRTVIPPLASIFIGLTKNTAIAEAFAVTEATYQLDSLVRDRPDVLWWLFAGISLGYVLIVAVISLAARLLERRLAVVR
ncbi:MAG: amino acid ABC transporter permease [Actinomycetales bacterium]